MATETLTAIKSQIALDDGTDSQGNTKTVNISLARLSKSGYDGNKYLAIVTALEPCLNKTVDSVNVVKTFGVSAS